MYVSKNEGQTVPMADAIRYIMARIVLGGLPVPIKELPTVLFRHPHLFPGEEPPTAYAQRRLDEVVKSYRQLGGIYPPIPVAKEWFRLWEGFNASTQARLNLLLREILIEFRVKEVLPEVVPEVLPGDWVCGTLGRCSRTRPSPAGPNPIIAA